MVRTKVVIPAAGLGTRFLPATKSMPKEMLPVLRQPVIQYVVEEAISAGANDLTIVTGLLKRAIEDHFDHNPELGPANLRPEVRELDELADRVAFHFVRQRAPMGLGHALGRAERHIDGEPFGVLLGDSIHSCRTPLLSQLHRVFQEMGGRASVIGLEEVERDRVHDYGIVGGPMVSPGVIDIREFVEKPDPAAAPSRLAITGAYYLTPTIFEVLRATRPDRKGEVQLTDALSILLAREKVYGLVFEGRRYDTGTPALWLETNLRFAWNAP
ncbi:MAG: UTP--glucose-1-phosphate uridylyltransferase, partial [Thermoplasmata archaeon]